MLYSFHEIVACKSHYVIKMMKYLLKPCMYIKIQMQNHKDIGPTVLVVAKVRPKSWDELALAIMVIRVV